MYVLWPIGNLPASDLSKLGGGGSGVQGQQRHSYGLMTKQIQHHSPFSPPPCQICFVSRENPPPWTMDRCLCSAHSFLLCLERKSNEKIRIGIMVTGKAEKQLDRLSFIFTIISPSNFYLNNYPSFKLSLQSSLLQIPRLSHNSTFP